MGEIWIARHGQTGPNVKALDEPELVRGQEDAPLTDEGIMEAKIIGQYLAIYSNNPNKIYAPDLIKMRETSIEISKALGNIPMYVADELLSWDMGDFEGEPLEDASFAYISRVRSFPNLPMPNGESFRQFSDRVTKFMDERLDEACEIDNDQILATHSKTIKLIQAYLDGLCKRVSVVSFLNYNIQKTGELMRIFKASGGWVYQMIPMIPTGMYNYDSEDGN